MQLQLAKNCEAKKLISGSMFYSMKNKKFAIEN